MAARSIVEEGQLTLEGERTAFKLVRVARRKNVHLYVDDDGCLSVRAPWRYSVASAVQVIEENRRWVVDTLRSTRAILRSRPPLISGSLLPLLDERLTLVVRLGAQRALLPAAGEELTSPKRATHRLRRRSGTVYRNRDRLCVDLQTLRMGALRELLEAWFREQAARRLPSRLGHYSKALGVTPRRVNIRAQKTRWGSCSMEGEISLNWRLVLLPSALADYILVHELCHLRHLDHSPKFWRLVASLIPDHQRRRDSIAALQPTLAL